MENIKQIINFGIESSRRKTRKTTEECELVDTIKSAISPSSHVFDKLGSTEEQDVTWTCAICGVVKPLKCSRGFLRNECACEREERYKRTLQINAVKQKQQEVAEKEKRDAAESRTDNCYMWLGEDYSDYGMDELTFSSFKTPNMELALIKEKVLAYANDLPLSIIMHGKFGTGKTHLACAILNHRRTLGKPGLFTTGANLFNALQARRESNEPTQDILSMLYKTPLLVIDDPDHMTSSDYRENIYKEVFGKRANRNLSTIITTNIHVPSNSDASILCAVIGGAAASRLNKGLVLVAMPGTTDLRKKQVGVKYS